MRPHYMLLLALLAAGCGGRSMNAHLARDLIMEIPGETLEKKDVEVRNVTQVSGSEAIAEATIHAAFRFEKNRGVWTIQEVRIGGGQWEPVRNIAQALELVKIKQTRDMLERIASSVEHYRQDHGTLPVFVDYIGLSDLLSPTYMSPLIRLDPWRRPLRAERSPSNGILLQSSGPDGKFGSSDDISRTIP